MIIFQQLITAEGTKNVIEVFQSNKVFCHRKMLPLRLGMFNLQFDKEFDVLNLNVIISGTMSNISDGTS